MQLSHRQLKHYGGALLAVAIALLFSLLLVPVTGNVSPFLPFTVAVMFSSRYGGKMPGVYATILSTIVCKYFLLNPIHSLSINNLADVVLQGEFIVVGLVIVWLNEQLYRAKREAEAIAQEKLSYLEYLDQSQKALKENENLFRTIFEQAPIGMAIVGFNGVLNDCNQDIEKLFGYTREELRNITFMDFTYPEDWERETKFFQAMKDGKCDRYQMEKRYIRKGGEVIWGNLTVSTIRDNKGNPQFCIGMVQDITERKRVEEELRESQRLIEKIANTTPHILYLYDLIEVRNIYVNREIGVSLDYTPKEIQEMGASVLPTIMHPDDFAVVPKQMAKFATAKDGEIVDWEYRLRNKKGEWRWIESRETIFKRTVEGLPQQVLGTCLDITNRKLAEEALRQSEERFRATFEQAAVGIAHVGVNGQWLLVNQKLCDIVGYTREELFELTFQDITYPEDLEIDLSYARQILANQIEVYAIEKRYICKDGSLVWVNLTVSLVKEASGKAQYFISVVEDITERKQAEDKLRISEERLRLALEAGRMGIWDWNIITNEINWSDNLEEIHGLIPGFFDGTFAGYLEIIHPQDRKSVQEAIASALADETEYDIEFRTLVPSGKSRWITAKGQTFRDEAGKAFRMLGIGMDISQRKQVEEERRRIENLYRNIARNFPNGCIFLFDKDLRYILAEGTGLSKINLTKESLEGKTIWEALPRPQAEKFAPLYQAALKGIETIFEGADAVSTCIIHILPLKNAVGVIFGGMVLTQDITERKKAEKALQENEERFRSLIENALDIITVLTEDGAIQYTSPSTERVLGYKPETVIGKNIFDYIHPDDNANIFYTLNNLIKNTGTTLAIEFSFQHHNGSWHILEAISKSFITSEQEVNIVVNCRDITERKRAEEMRSLLEKEKELSQIKNRFFSMASHEFRTPITAILLSTQLLLESCENKNSQDKLVRNLHRIQGCAKNMTNLLEDILTINRAESDRLEFNPETTDLKQFCCDLVEEIQLLAGGDKKINYVCEGDCENAYVDEKIMRSLLSNLLLNAIKYSPDESSVDFFVKCQEQEAIFTIRDRGIGIAVEDQKEIFEPFYRGNNIKKIPGSGLGLTVVKKCVDLHKGTIELKSALGVGTTIIVNIPLNLNS